MRKLSTGILLAILIAFSSCKAKKELAVCASANTQLHSDLAACNTNLTNTTNADNAKIADLNSQLSTCTSLNASLAKDAAAYKQLKADMKARQDRMNADMKEIREKIIQGLSQLADSGIDVSFKNGFLYVTLPEATLFPEGSATLNPKSKSALSPLASVLNNYPNVQVYVIGNTDSKTIHTARFTDNWSLSTERANSIVRVLRDKYSMDPTRLLAGGRSKYNPVADNGTKEGRALNRRIQIVLNPDLTKLWEMMEENN